MQKVRVLTPVEAAGLIADNDVVTVSSSSGLGCPDAVLAGLGERFDHHAEPRDLIMIHPIAAGDMYGIKGIDHIAKPGLLKRIIAGSYPSGPSSWEPPEVWKMIENNLVDAYNIPSGILFQMHRAAATHQPGVLTHVGQDTFMDPAQQGGKMNECTTVDLVENVEFDNERWMYLRAIIPNVAIIRATTSDEFGNLTFEEEGSPLGALDQAYAAHNNGGIVIAQVKRMAQQQSLHPQEVRVPGILVDAVVISPDQLQTTNTVNDPAISGQLRQPLSLLPPVEFSLEKVIARRAAQELHSGEIVNLGFGVSALVPHILVEEGVGREVSWAIEQGAVGGVPLLDFAFGCSQNPDAIMQSIDQFTLLQGGGFHHALLSFLEIDQHGNVNVHHLPSKRHVTAGVGGFADITSSAPNLLFIGSFTAGRKQISIVDNALRIEEDGRHSKLVEHVSAVTFSGERALARGQHVQYITERCVIELRKSGMTVTEVAPGVDLQRDVLDRAGFALRVADEVTVMNTKIFAPALLGLTLPPASPKERLTWLDA